MEETRVAIISEDSEFVDSILQSWQRLRWSPNVSVQSLSATQEPVQFAVVLTDTLQTLDHLSPSVILAIAVVEENEAADMSGAAEAPASLSRVLRIPRRKGWACESAALAQETVMRLESQAQLAELKQRLREAERFAALGKFLSEARHGLGNALTGVLGNSELLLLEGETELHGQVRAKVEMIRQMSLKLHETFQRLSSLDLELRRHADQDSIGKPSQ